MVKHAVLSPISIFIATKHNADDAPWLAREDLTNRMRGEFVALCGGISNDRNSNDNNNTTLEIGTGSIWMIHCNLAQAATGWSSWPSCRRRPHHQQFCVFWLRSEMGAKLWWWMRGTAKKMEFKKWFYLSLIWTLILMLYSAATKIIWPRFWCHNSKL